MKANKYDEFVINTIINNKIKIQKRKNNENFLEFRDKILEIGADNIKRHGINSNMDEIPFSNLCYHGALRKILNAFDKITINRFDSSIIKNRYIKKIKIEESSVEVEMIQNMIDNAVKFDIKLLDKFLDFVLYLLGDSNFNKLDFNDKDNEYFFKNFKPIPILFFPFGYFMNLTKWTYFNMSFEKYVNLTLYELDEILSLSCFCNLNYSFKKIILIESYFYAPHFVKTIKKYF